MTEIDPLFIKEFKDLPFSKSWQNNFVSKTHQILNVETKQLEEKTLEDFLYIPGPTLVRHFASDRNFLGFRNDNKFEKDWDYKLVDDKTENNNRRMAIFYVARILEALELKFMVDTGYGLFIEIEELAEKAKSEEGIYKELFLHFSIPKSITTRHGAVESWGG